MRACVRALYNHDSLLPSLITTRLEKSSFPSLLFFFFFFVSLGVPLATRHKAIGKQSRVKCENSGGNSHPVSGPSQTHKQISSYITRHHTSQTLSLSHTHTHTKTHPIRASVKIGAGVSFLRLRAVAAAATPLMAAVVGERGIRVPSVEFRDAVVRGGVVVSVPAVVG